MRLFIRSQLIIALLSIVSGSAMASSIQLKPQGDTLSLELSGQSDWNYELKRLVEKSQTKVLLTVKGLDDDNFQEIKNVKNPFIKSIHVKPALLDGRKQIEFTLSSEKVETFDYLTDYPSKLIVDFYFNEPIEKKEPQAVVAKKQSVSGSSKKDRAARAPADAEFYDITNSDSNGATVNLKGGLFNPDREDRLARFRINIAELKPPPPPYELSDYYGGYPILERPFGFWAKMKENAPEYEIQPEDNEENKQIRLIKKLYTKKRTLVLGKTTEWFAKKYPESKYLELAYAMTADSYLQLWHKENKNEIFDLSQYYYEKLMLSYPDSALYERTSLATGMQQLDKKNYLIALRKFKTHMESPRFKDKNSNYYAQLGMTYCLAKLNKVNEAIKIAKDIENTSLDELTQSEAAFRKGDYLMMSEKYAEAKNHYEASAKKYPHLLSLYPNGVFNKMEALFHLKMPIESHAVALDFTQKFSQDEFAPYALTRLGELLEMVGAPQEKSIGAYLETQFRYGESPKTIVARLHLMSTRMKGMQELELKQTIDKMNELSRKSDLEYIDQFKTIMLSDGFSRRKEFNKAIDILVKYYQEFPGKKNSGQISSRIKSNILGNLRNLSLTHKHRDVLKVYRQFADNWFRKEEGADTFYYLGNAYLAAGAYEDAMMQFSRAEEKLLSTQDSIRESNLALPKIEEIFLRQSQSLFEQNNLKKAEMTLDKIKNPEALEPAEQVSRVNLASLLYERRGDNETAIRYLSEIVRVWKDKPDLVAESAIRLAKLWKNVNNPQKGIDLLDNFLKEKLTTSNVRKVYKAKSDIALDAQLSETAIKSLTFLISGSEKPPSENLAEEKYRWGDLYFQKGEIKKAENIWSSFSENDDKFWSKLADEKMKSAQWQDEYKKYLKRIPAAVGVQ